MRLPKHDMSIFKQRRAQLAKVAGQGAAFILPAHPDLIRNNDVHHPYRQDSNLFYFTGFEEQNSVLVFRPGLTPETVLFVQPKDLNMEVWDGFRYGPEGAKKYFHADEAYSIESLQQELPKLLKNVEKIHYTMFIDKNFDQTLLKLIEEHAHARSRTNKGNLAIEDARALIGEMRLIKTSFEIEQMRKACEITSAAHVEVMRATRPGVNERALQGTFINAIMQRGCAREGYGSIVASGANATTLHYVFNDQVCREGELLLVDAGGEYNYYTADITRTYPVGGKFSPTQKRVYQKMLDLQKTIIDNVKPGQTREGLQKMTIAGLTDILIDENLLKGKREELIEKKEYFKFYPHGVGHWLGLDVHDAGRTEVAGEPRPLAAGMVLTIEPGLYISNDIPGVPEDYRGIGIRIEDNILVTETGHENLTANCPKEVADLESIVGNVK